MISIQRHGSVCNSLFSFLELKSHHTASIKRPIDLLSQRRNPNSRPPGVTEKVPGSATYTRRSRGVAFQHSLGICLSYGCPCLILGINPLRTAKTQPAATRHRSIRHIFAVFNEGGQKGAGGFPSE